MRKILYSPGYGAGWVTWHYGTREQKLFMLEYAPFIQALESQTPEARAAPVYREIDGDRFLACLPVEHFLAEWTERFPGVNPPYLGGLGGLGGLVVAEVEGEVRLDEYDGSESYTTRGTDTEWL